MSKVAESILKVSFSVGKITKNGTNDHFKFKYQAWDDVLPEVRNACVEHGLTIIPNVVSVTPMDKKILVMLNFVMISGEDRIEALFAGESNNNDDKAIQKAITSATKYFFLKTFMIPCQGDIDPDGEGEPKQKAPTESATKKADVKKETDVQKERVARAEKAFIEMGIADNETKAKAVANAKKQAEKDNRDWVEVLEEMADPFKEPK